MRKPSRIILLVGLTALPSAANADVLWKADFETGDIKQWTGSLIATTGQRKNITVVDSPLVQGSHACQLVVHPDDLWSNGHNRVELQQAAKMTKEGETTFFSWYFQLPINVTIHEDIGYWETKTSYQQSMDFFVEPLDGAMQVGFRTNKPSRRQQWAAPLTAGAWHQIAVQIFWSQMPTAGKVSVWFDGAKVVNEAAAQTKPDSNDLFVQVGFHRDRTDPSVDTLYLDNALEGTTIDDVLGTSFPNAGGGTAGGGTAGNSASTAGAASAGMAGNATETGGAGGSGGAGGWGPAGETSAGTSGSTSTSTSTPSTSSGSAGSTSRGGSNDNTVSTTGSSHEDADAGCSFRVASSRISEQGSGARGGWALAALAIAATLRKRLRAFSGRHTNQVVSEVARRG